MVSTTPARGRARVGLLQVCAAGVLWGTGGIVATVLNDREGFGAMTVSAWRMGLAALALIAFALATRRWGLVVATMRTHPLLAVLIGCGTAAYQGLYFVSVLLVGVSVATVVALGLAPVLAAVWEHLATRTRPSWREAVVLVAALTGLILISTTTNGAGTTTGGAGTTTDAVHTTTEGATVPLPAAATDDAALGLIIAVAAGATYAVTTVLGHRLAQRVDPVALTTCATAAGAIALAPFFGVAAATSSPVLTTDPGSLALLAYLGIATMALSYGLLYAGLRTTSGSTATVATLVEPLSAALLAAVLLGERLAWPALVGGALILAAVAGLRPTQENPAPA